MKTFTIILKFRNEIFHPANMLVNMLDDSLEFELDDMQWQAFQEALDSPVQSKPRLKELLREPGLLD